MNLKLFWNIKLNKNFKYFKKFPNFLSSSTPEISNKKCEKIEMIKNGAIWKTTSECRNKKLINWVNQYLKNINKKHTIMELGCSSGVSVFPGLKNKNKIKKYIFSDLQLHFFYKKIFTFTLIYENKKNWIPFMAYNDILILYSDNYSLNFVSTIISAFFRMILSIISLTKNKISIHLLDDRILEYKKKYSIEFKEHNILLPIKNYRTNLIIALNLLNNSYFSNKEINKIVSNIHNSLKNNDLIIIADNRIIDRISVFKKKFNKFNLIYKSGGDVDFHKQFLNFEKNN